MRMICKIKLVIFFDRIRLHSFDNENINLNTIIHVLQQRNLINNIVMFHDRPKYQLQKQVLNLELKSLNLNFSILVL